MKKILKAFLFGKGVRQKRILFGIGSGIKMNISFEHKAQRFLGLEEREIHTAFKRFAPSTPVFVDIGASDGYYGLIYHKFNNHGDQFLCDAELHYAKLQLDHYLLNDFDTRKVNIISKLIADFTDDTHIALDDLLQSTLGPVFFKIDVDGAEMHVLKGAENILQQRPCKLIVETHSPELETECVAYLRTLGYTSTIIPNAWWRAIVPELRPIAHNRWLSAERK